MRNLEIKNNDCHAALAMTKSVQSGRSMIEMLGVLAIIGVLSVGGIAGYSKAMMKYRINKTIEQITLIAGNIHTFFANQRSYADLNSNDKMTIIKKAKLVPDEMLTLDSDGNITAMTNPFGGNVDLTGFAHSNENQVDQGKGYFCIYYDEVPEEACIDLMSQDWSATGAKYICAYAPNPNCMSTPDIAVAQTICSNRTREYLFLSFDGTETFEHTFY
ncbi:MAG: hypothetical protein IJ525_06630 [Alphaproteobacteria bacterium]|nr:hypothetical protein [Alphaproteobacteria bacterium]